MFRSPCPPSAADPAAVPPQTTRGHQFLTKNFGDTAIPRGTWQIDVSAAAFFRHFPQRLSFAASSKAHGSCGAQPFGHSNTEAWLLGAEAGFESLFWGRTDYQDLNYRMSYEGQQNNQWPEWVWRGSQSLGSSAEVFAGQLTTHNCKIVMLSRFATLFRLASPESIAIADIQVNYAKIAFLVGAAPGQDPKCAQSLRSIRLCAQQCDSQHCSYARGERESSSGCARRPCRERPIVQGRCAGRNRREHRPLGVVHHRAGSARDGEGIL